MTTGERIKAARKRANMTQTELAKLLGVSGSMVAQYETGKRKPKIETLERISDALEIPLVDLIDISPEEKERRREFFEKAWKAAEQKAGKQLSFKEAMEFYRFDTAIYIRLEGAIKKLNNEGRKVALERIEELTLIDKYTLPVIDPD